MSLGIYTVVLPEKDLKLEKLREFKHTYPGKTFREHEKLFAVDTFKIT